MIRRARITACRRHRKTVPESHRITRISFGSEEFPDFWQKNFPVPTDWKPTCCVGRWGFREKNLEKGVDPRGGGRVASRPATKRGGRATRGRTVRKQGAGGRGFTRFPERGVFFDSTARKRSPRRDVPPPTNGVRAGRRHSNGYRFRAGERRLVCAPRAGSVFLENGGAREKRRSVSREGHGVRRPDFGVAVGPPGPSVARRKIIFTESLILAQNERWRRV